MLAILRIGPSSLLSFARTSLAAGLVLAPLFFAGGAGAVGTRTFVLDTLEKMSGGDLKGVSVSSDGTVRAGLTLGSAPIPDATSVFAATTLDAHRHEPEREGLQGRR
jgi:hypothetical protein